MGMNAPASFHGRVVDTTSEKGVVAMKVQVFLGWGGRESVGIWWPAAGIRRR